MSAQISLERIKRAGQWQPGAFQVILADWFPLREPEMIACLERLAAAADPVGLVLYNPPHAKVVLTPAQIGRLRAALPSLIGVKVADGDAIWYAQMRAHCQEVAVFVPGHHLATGLANGAAGAYSNVACLSPAGSQRWYQQMLTDLPAALAVEQRIRRFLWGMRRMADAAGRFKMTAVDQRPPIKNPIMAQRGTAEAPWEDVAGFKSS